jgi:hypothetical protein
MHSHRVGAVGTAEEEGVLLFRILNAFHGFCAKSDEVRVR